MTPDRIRAYFRKQGESCAALGSPFMGQLCAVLADLLDDRTQTGRRILAWPEPPGASALALRLAGGLHSLVLTGADPALAEAYPPRVAGDDAVRETVRAALVRNDAALARWLDSAPQTNEIGRSAMLLPGYLALARQTQGLPFDLNEIGASAGLNLFFDRFAYRYGEAEWGDPRSPVKLAPEVRGAPVPLEGGIEIASRRGADIAPLDVSDARDRLRLRAYIWPDQAARLQRLDAALALAGREPPELEQRNAVAFVADRLERRAEGRVFVLAHTIMWQYMPELDRARIARAMRSAGAEATEGAPVAWLRMESEWPQKDWAVLSLTLWPGGQTRELARCDFHGRWIEWIG